MAGFKAIIGHEQVIAHLSTALKNEKISHAYIFNGEHGCGKKMLAKTFAKALECEAGYGDCCDMCRACHQADTGNHPDIRWVTHEKPSSIGVEDIRVQVNNDIEIKPYSGKYKIYIIDEAEKMTQQAQNALLKTIEEPPSYGVIILLTSSIDALLPTIRSRCVTLNLKAVEFEKIKDYLMQQYEIPDYQAKVCAAFAQGNVGRAIALAASGEFNELKDHMVKLVRRIGDLEIYDLMSEVKEIQEFQAPDDFFDLMLMWYRDVLLCKASQGQGKLIFQDQAHEIQRQAGNCSYGGLEKILAAIEKTRRRFRANVNQEMSMELLLLTIKENIK